MNSDFALKKLGDFRLPCGKIRIADGRGAIDADAQSQSTLMLVRERNQISVAQHSGQVPLRSSPAPVESPKALPQSVRVRRRGAGSASQCGRAPTLGSAFHWPRKSRECGNVPSLPPLREWVRAPQAHW